jgi:hypothetical protein
MLDHKLQNTLRVRTVCAGKLILPVFAGWQHHVESFVDVPYVSTQSRDMFTVRVLTIVLCVELVDWQEVGRCKM